MSKQEDKTQRGLDPEAFPRLEEAVKAACVRIEALRAQLQAAQSQGGEMEELLRKFTGGEEDPAELMARLKRLEAENQEFSDRLQKGREGVDRLLARIRFLEEQG